MKPARTIGILLIIFVTPFLFHGPAFAFLGSSLDCNSALREASRGKELIGDWSNPGVGDSPPIYTSSKEDIRKSNEDYCLLQRHWNIKGILQDEQEVKITYFSNPKEAIAAMFAVKESEPETFRTSSKNDTRYVGATYVGGVYDSNVLDGIAGYKVSGPLHGRTVAAIGNCLIQSKDQLNGVYVYLTESKYESDWLEPMRKNTSGFVDGLSAHAAVQSFCGGKSAPKSSPAPQSPRVAQAPSNSPIDLIDTWIQETFGVLDIQTMSQPPERKPAITEEIEPPKSISPEYTNFVGIINRQGDNRAQVLLPGATEFTELGMGDVPPGSIIQSHDDQVVIFPEPKGNIIVVNSDSEFTVSQNQQNPSIDMQKGTVEMKAEKSPPEQPVQQREVHTEFLDLVVIGTHFWVTHEPGKRTTVGVYEGTVRVTPRGSNISKMVSPTDGKPGVIVVSRKASWIKLLLPALITLGVIVGVIWIIRKRK